VRRCKFGSGRSSHIVQLNINRKYTKQSWFVAQKNLEYRTLDTMSQCRISVSRYQCINVVCRIWLMSRAACDVELLSSRSYSDSGNSIQFHQFFVQPQWTEIGGINFRKQGVSKENMDSKLRCIFIVTKLQMFNFARINVHFSINTRMNFSTLISYKIKLISNLLYLSKYRYIHNMRWNFFLLQYRNFKIIRRGVE
jgi:hypothetical protein